MTEMVGGYLARMGRTAKEYVERLGEIHPTKSPSTGADGAEEERTEGGEGPMKPHPKPNRPGKPKVRTRGRKWTMNSETILLATLQQNGVEKPGDLARYVNDEVFKYGNRLCDLTSRLRLAHREMKHVSTF